MIIITKEMVAAGEVDHPIISYDSTILSDLDGTVLPLLHDPKQRRIVRDAAVAFRRFNEATPNQIIPITGRDWEQVGDCFHGRAPNLLIVSSNGAEIHQGDETLNQYPFTISEQIFKDDMQNSMREFKIQHPELVTEIKRHEIGFHGEAATGFGHLHRDHVLQIAEKCADMMERLENAAEKRRLFLPDGKTLAFSVAGTEVTHREMSHRGIDKLKAVLEFFRDQLPEVLHSADWSSVIYCGDSLRKGNDREIAIAVRERGGMVFQVINDSPDRIPDEDDPAHPHFVFNDPDALGAFLLRQVSGLERKVARTPRRGKSLDRA